jgi:hypothetical protein
MPDSREAGLPRPLRIVRGVNTFDLRRVETYDERAAVVAVVFLWPLDPVSHPAV